MKKVMIVEDDRFIVDALTARLKAEGYQVNYALDPVIGLSVIVREKPDVVIIDLNMPAGGGFLMAERVIRHPDLGRIPFIVITASKLPQSREKATSLGIKHYLEKPFKTEELLEALQECLRDDKQEDKK